MTNKLKLFMQYLAPQQWLSRLSNILCECGWIWWKNWQIRFLIRHYGADLRSAKLENIADYPNFNSFFTRLLKPELRPIVSGANQIACPVDGVISQIGSIQNDVLFQAKGFYFNLSTLLGGSKKHGNLFFDGYYATLYLAPKDYHRVHMPLTGVLRETIYIPGKLFSVNTVTTSQIPQLFARNERLVCLFDTELGSMAVILVGAMLVSSIHTVWGADTPRTREITSVNYSVNYLEPIKLERGAELGHFKMGSTVIVLFAKDAITWSEELAANSVVKMGQLLGTGVQ